MKEKEYMHIEVAPYALPSTIYALWHNGVRSFAITQQDNDLYIGIEVDYLRKVVYNEYNKGECCSPNKEE